jgi:hypothetical protein
MKPLHSQPAQRGIALVIVLAFLVLIAGLMIAFFSNVSTEFSSARSFADGVTTKQLADSAVNVVMGQIREGTAMEGGAWASQPGMIRVYGTAGTTPAAALTPSDKLHSLYKLYSSEQLLVSGTDLEKAENVNETFTDWWKQPAAFTDLNQPVKLTLQNTGAPNTVSYRYPIMDPYFSKYLATNGKDANGNPRSGSDFVEGFDLTADGSDNRTLAEEEKIARMPARWIYVLRDGTLTTGKAKNTTIEWDATTPVSQRPSAENPIVGRIAYWTDDETSKVNINTAGGTSPKDIPADYNERSYAGSFWDTPRTRAPFEIGSGFSSATGEFPKNGGGLAISQPLNGEFQRYPGHPATTSLGLVLQNLPLGLDFIKFLTTEQIYKIAPRIMPGGSLGGTGLLPSGSSPVVFTPLAPKSDRLFASVDELIFSAANDGNQKRLANARALFPDVKDEETLKKYETTFINNLEKTRFFLTAHSRSPELNLYGRPRVSLWPIRADDSSDPNGTKYRTKTDNLLAFCATISSGSAKKPFYFQRIAPYSPTADALIPRNTKIREYLDSLTDKAIPGFSPSGSESFAAKFGKDDKSQVLTEMFDYIRTINLREASLDDIMVKKFPGSTPANVQEREKVKFAPRGIVVPVKLTAGTQKGAGIGRFPTISEASIVLYHAGYVINRNDGTPDTVTLDYRWPLKTWKPDGTQKIVRPTLKANLVRAFLLFELFNPMQGYASTAPKNSSSSNLGDIAIQVSGMGDFAIQGQPLGFPSTEQTRSLNGALNFYSAIGGTQGFFNTLYLHNGTSPTAKNYYPFQSTGPGVSIPVPAPTSNPIITPLPDVSLKGVTLTVKILFEKTEVQTYTMAFPDSAVVPMPTDAVWLYGNYPAVEPDTETKTGGWPGGWASDPGGFYPGVPAGKDQGDWGCGSDGDDSGFVKSLAGRIYGRKTALSPVYGIFGPGGNGLPPYKGDPPAANNIFRLRQLIQPGDTVRSLIFTNENSNSNKGYDGDLRISAITEGTSRFKPHPDYLDPNVRFAQNLTLHNNGGYSHVIGSYISGSTGFPSTNLPPSFSNGRFGYFQVVGNPEKPDPSAKYPLPRMALFPYVSPLPATLPAREREPIPAVAFGKLVRNAQPSDLVASVNGVMRQDGQPGDFDTGLGVWADGPYAGKTQEGLIGANPSKDPKNGVWGYGTPYFGGGAEDIMGAIYSPNRQVPSAVVFGSLPRGRDKHWETLCFSPNPAGINHPGNVAPKDSLLLDLFQMPVVEPYTISESFSTDGKVNMNYAIAPYNWIQRSTGMRAALQSVRVTAIPATDFNVYKNANTRNYRLLVDADETLKAFDDLFTSKGELFRSATQICERFLYPKYDETGKAANLNFAPGEANIKNFWYGDAKTKNNGHTLTGDNLREQPYGALYPRLTTKSNTYTVHMRVQTLRKKPGSKHEVWDEVSDQVTSEYRGSSTVERYIDPHDPRFDDKHPDYIDVDKQSLEPAYRFRVVNSKRFQPY